jgi:hypothetical protein
MISHVKDPISRKIAKVRDLAKSFTPCFRSIQGVKTPQTIVRLLCTSKGSQGIAVIFSPLGIRSGRDVVRFPNLFFSVLRAIRPREYGMIVLVLSAFAFMATAKASGINSLSFERAVEPHAFSLLSSCSFEAIPQESLTGFDVVTRRQKHSKVFSSCLRPCCEAPCNLTAVFSLDEVSKENTADLGVRSGTSHFLKKYTLFYNGENYESAA